MRASFYPSPFGSLIPTPQKSAVSIILHPQFCQDWPEVFLVPLSWTMHDESHRSVRKQSLVDILRFSRFFFVVRMRAFD